MNGTRPVVQATQVEEFVRHHGCGRRFKLDHDNRRLADQLPFFYQLSSTMDPVLQEAWRKREREWDAAVRGAGLVDLCRETPPQPDDAWIVLCVKRAADPIVLSPPATGETGCRPFPPTL